MRTGTASVDLPAPRRSRHRDRRLDRLRRRLHGYTGETRPQQRQSESQPPRCVGRHLLPRAPRMLVDPVRPVLAGEALPAELVVVDPPRTTTRGHSAELRKTLGEEGLDAGAHRSCLTSLTSSGTYLVESLLAEFNMGWDTAHQGTISGERERPYGRRCRPRRTP